MRKKNEPRMPPRFRTMPALHQLPPLPAPPNPAPSCCLCPAFPAIKTVDVARFWHKRYDNSTMKYLSDAFRYAQTRLKPYQDRLQTLWQGLNMRAKLSLLFIGLILVTTAFFYGFAVFQTTREIKIGAIY